jgi:predicted nucleic-acid-binding protein
MRIIDVLSEASMHTIDDPSSVLTEILYFLEKKAEADPTRGVISMSAIKALMSNRGFDIDYKDFVQLYDTTPAISNLVDSFSGDEVVLDKKSKPEVTGGKENIKTDEPVDDMAKRAMNKRK